MKQLTKPPKISHMRHHVVFVTGFYDSATIRDMLKECSRMSSFDHPNVLTLRGVCLDGGPAPYIIMPFMSNGNLLTYLKNNRESLIVSTSQRMEDDQDEMVCVASYT